MSAPVPPKANHDLHTPIAMPSQRVRNFAEFAALSSDEQQSLLIAWQAQWQAHSTPGAPAVSNGPRIVVPDAAASEDRDAWKGSAPSKADIENLERGDWKKF